MALQSSGAISLSDIASEFGDSTPNSISEFYRGGSLVPNTSTNTNVPTSGQISFSQFYGAADQLWSMTVTNGYYSVAGFVTVFYRGFKSGTSEDNFWVNSINIGSANDTTVDFLSGSNLITLGESTLEVDQNTTGELIFEVAGAHSNSGFTTLKIGGVSYNRTSATYTQGSSNTRWVWNTSSGAAPFGENSNQQTNTSVVFV